LWQDNGSYYIIIIWRKWLMKICDNFWENSEIMRMDCSEEP
jgi:hypothetical protein